MINVIWRRVVESRIVDRPGNVTADGKPIIPDKGDLVFMDQGNPWFVDKIIWDLSDGENYIIIINLLKRGSLRDNGI